MSDRQRQYYPTLWWGLQEVHLTSFPAWLDAGEPTDWVGLEEYQQQAIDGIHLFISLMIGNYLISVQKMIDIIYSLIENKTDLTGFTGKIYQYEYRFDFLSEHEFDRLFDICSYIERYAFDSADESGEANNFSRLVYEYQDFIILLKEHKRNIEYKYFFY